ncbi:MAG: cytochrome c oxidase subunit II [Pseudomonadota bacterium]
MAVLTSVGIAVPALANTPIGQPKPGGLNFQEPATRIAERIHAFSNGIHFAMLLIALFVMGLLIWVCFRYNERRNPEPRKFSHNTTVEVVWTVVPVLILIGIAGPSFSNLFYQENEPDLVAIAEAGSTEDPNVNIEAAEQGWITVKAIGMGNWAWTYEYPDELDADGFPVSFVSNGIHLGFPTCTPDEFERKQAGEQISCDPPHSVDRPLYLAADYPMVVPVNRYIRYQTASDRVIHSWVVPAFGVKTDAVPGRLNEGWFLVRETGVFYGQCSELCGKNHAFMPIEVRVVPQAQYERWLELMKTGDFDAAREAVLVIADDAGAQIASLDLN